MEYCLLGVLGRTEQKCKKNQQLQILFDIYLIENIVTEWQPFGQFGRNKNNL